MPALTINTAVLKKICQLNQFDLPDTALVFIGIRGCIPINVQDQQFKASHPLSVIDINYINPRCTLLQWRLSDNKIATFPGSTVPHVSSIKQAKIANGVGANCLFTGFYTDYRKGHHKAGTSTGHEAFRQNAVHPIRRSTDDLDFDHDDRVEYDNPNDNIHCGWFASLTSEYYASAGCQVIMGYPKCKKPGRTENSGPWKVFHDNAYNLSQDSFPYILVTGLETMNICNNVNKKLPSKLRFGSSGKIVEALQNALKEKDFYEGQIDGNFGERTMKSIIAYQKIKFGKEGADGVVGPITAQELGIELPTL
jgi:hypothetical protein